MMWWPRWQVPLWLLRSPVDYLISGKAGTTSQKSSTSFWTPHSGCTSGAWPPKCCFLFLWPLETSITFCLTALAWLQNVHAPLLAHIAAHFTQPHCTPLVQVFGSLLTPTDVTASSLISASPPHRFPTHCQTDGSRKQTIPVTLFKIPGGSL